MAVADVRRCEAVCYATILNQCVHVKIMMIIVCVCGCVSGCGNGNGIRTIDKDPAED